MAVKCNIHSSITIKDAQAIIEELYQTYTPKQILKLEITKNDNSSLWSVIEIHDDGAEEV